MKLCAYRKISSKTNPMTDRLVMNLRLIGPLIAITVPLAAFEAFRVMYDRSIKSLLSLSTAPGRTQF